MANAYLTPWRASTLPGLRTAGLGGGSLFDLHQQMNQLFDDLFERGPRGESGASSGAGIAAPALDVRQDDGKMEITAELPGVREEDIDLSVEDGVLTLRGEKKRTWRDEERGYSERSYGSFERRITLPSTVDEDKCSADFKDGVLTITLPKTAEKARGRKIPLGGSRQQGTIEARNENEPAPRQQAAAEPEDGGGQQA